MQAQQQQVQEKKISRSKSPAAASVRGLKREKSVTQGFQA